MNLGKIGLSVFDSLQKTFLYVPNLSDIVLEKSTLASYVVVSERDIVEDIDNTINPEGIKKDE